MKKAKLLGALSALLLLYTSEAWASQWAIGILVPKADNQSGFPVWRNRFDPSDPLPTETAETFATLLRRFPSLEVFQVKTFRQCLTAELTFTSSGNKSDVLGATRKGPRSLVAYDGAEIFILPRRRNN